MPRFWLSTSSSRVHFRGNRRAESDGSGRLRPAFFLSLFSPRFESGPVAQLVRAAFGESRKRLAARTSYMTRSHICEVPASAGSVLDSCRSRVRISSGPSRFARCARRFGAAAPKSRQLRCRSRRAHHHFRSAKMADAFCRGKMHISLRSMCPTFWRCGAKIATASLSLSSGPFSYR